MFVRKEVDEQLHRKLADDTVYEVVVATFPDRPSFRFMLSNIHEPPVVPRAAL